MSCVEDRLVGGDRNRYGDLLPLAFVTFDSNHSAEREDAFAQAEEPERQRALDFVVPDTPPVVFDAESECAPAVGQRDVHAGCVGVARDVGEQFLESAKKRGGALLVGIDEAGVDRNQAADAGAPLELARLPFERGGKPDLVEHFGAQSPGYAAHRVDDAADGAPDPLLL